MLPMREDKMDHNYVITYEIRVPVIKDGNIVIDEKTNRPKTQNLDLNIRLNLENISDHPLLDRSYNLWAVGSPRQDLPLPAILAELKQNDPEQFKQVQEKLDQAGKIDMNPKFGWMVKLKDEVTIMKHLSNLATQLIQALDSKDYIALQEVVSPNIKDKKYFDYFLGMLKDKYIKNALDKIEEKQESPANENQKKEIEAKWNYIEENINKTLRSKFNTGSTPMEHCVLINPDKVKSCLCYESNNGSEKAESLGAHLYRLSKVDGTVEVIANAHSNYTKACDTAEQIAKLVDNGVTVLGDINVLSKPPADKDEFKHKEANIILDNLRNNDKYTFREMDSCGKTLDIVVEIKDATVRQQLAKEFLKSNFDTTPEAKAEKSPAAIRLFDHGKVEKVTHSDTNKETHKFIK